MPSFIDFFPLVVTQSVGPQRLERVPEPTQLTAAADNVIQYDRVMATKLVVAYVAGLEVIYRARSDGPPANAIDLACGPGHFTLCLSKYLGYSSVQGFDLSEPMVATASRNVASQGMDGSVRFAAGDATNLSGVSDGQADLCSFTDASHHMPDLSTVTGVLREMERVTRPEGLIVVMDLVRLRTKGVTEKYVHLLAHDYVDRGLPQFFDDFRNSMYAAWTAAELRKTVPPDTERTWCHIVPRGLPTIQFLLGLPVGRDKPFVRAGWPIRQHPLIQEWLTRWEQDVSRRWAHETLNECGMLQMSLRFAARRFFRPGAFVNSGEIADRAGPN